MQTKHNQHIVKLDQPHTDRDKLIAAICGAVTRAIPLDADIPDSGDLPIRFEIRGRTKRPGARVIVTINPAHLRKVVCVTTT